MVGPRKVSVLPSSFLLPATCFVPTCGFILPWDLLKRSPSHFSNLAPLSMAGHEARDKWTGLNDMLVIDREGLRLLQMISAEAPVLFAKAAQIFITELTLRAWIHTEDNKRRTLQVIKTHMGKLGKRLPLPSPASLAWFWAKDCSSLDFCQVDV